MLTLHDLIQQRFDERGWSYGELERRSNGKLSKGRWQQIGSHTRLNAFPQVATVRVIAEVLDVDETTVVLAAAASVGLDVQPHGSLLAQMLPAGTDLLSDRMRSAILNVIRAAVTEAARQP